jgi:hypothetical protein
LVEDILNMKMPFNVGELSETISLKMTYCFMDAATDSVMKLEIEKEKTIKMAGVITNGNANQELLRKISKIKSDIKKMNVLKHDCEDRISLIKMKRHFIDLYGLEKLEKLLNHEIRK